MYIFREQRENKKVQSLTSDTYGGILLRSRSRVAVVEVIIPKETREKEINGGKAKEYTERTRRTEKTRETERERERERKVINWKEEIDGVRQREEEMLIGVKRTYERREGETSMKAGKTRRRAPDYSKSREPATGKLLEEDPRFRGWFHNDWFH